MVSPVIARYSPSLLFTNGERRHNSHLRGDCNAYRSSDIAAVRRTEIDPLG
jgi:hypothetical protein